MSGKAEAAVANGGLVKFMVPCSTLAFAEWASSTPVILARRRDVAFAINFVTTPAFFPITRLVFSRRVPSRFTRSSFAEWCRPIPIIDTFASDRSPRCPRYPECPLIQIGRSSGYGRIVGREKLASRRIGEASRLIGGGLGFNVEALCIVLR